MFFINVVTLAVYTISNHVETSDQFYIKPEEVVKSRMPVSQLNDQLVDCWSEPQQWREGAALLSLRMESYFLYVLIPRNSFGYALYG